MTDNEIVEAFKMHLLDNRDCELCPYGPAYYRCDIILLKDALDLINRLQAENERLSKIIRPLIAEIKAEAYTEFAEKLKEYATQGFWETDAYVGTEQIDNLLKEMVGENNDS